MPFYEDEPDVTPEEMQMLENQGRALYELRLNQLDENRDHDERRCRLWASSCFGEAMLILEQTFGLKGAEKVMMDMLKARSEYVGPRTKRVRH